MAFFGPGVNGILWTMDDKVLAHGNSVLVLKVLRDSNSPATNPTLFYANDEWLSLQQKSTVFHLKQRLA